MELHYYKHKGTPAFPREVAIDFDALPTVIALHGPNGKGKTTTLDLIVACFYLSMPFRPGPLHQAFETEGFIDLIWSWILGGRRYHSRINVSPRANRTEASLFPAEGGPALGGPLTKNYLEAIKDIGIPPLEVFLSTAYTIQPSYTTSKTAFSFLLAERSARRGIFAELLGLKKYTAREQIAKDKAAAIETKLAADGALIRQLETELVKRPAVTVAVTAAEARLATAQTVREDAQNRLEASQKALEAAKGSRQALDPYRQQKSLLEAEVQSLTQRVNNASRDLQLAADTIAAALPHEGAQAQKEALLQARAALAPLEARKKTLIGETRELEGELEEIAATLKTDEALLGEEDKILAAVETTDRLKAEIAEMEDRIREATALDTETTAAYDAWLTASHANDLKRAELARQLDLVERLETSAAIQSTVPCKAEEPFAGCQFLTDAALSARQIPTARSLAAEIEGGLLDLTPMTKPELTAPALQAKKRTLSMEVAGYEPIVAKQAGFAAAQARVAANTDRKRRLALALDDKRTELDATTGDLEQAPVLDQQLQELEPKVILARKLGPARVAEETAKAALAQAQADLTTKAEALAGVRVLLADIPGLDTQIKEHSEILPKLQSVVRESQTMISSVERELGSLQNQIVALNEIEKRLTQHRDEQVPLRDEMSDWLTIARCMSPTGIPALKTDQAVPAISTLATSMLQECFGQALFTLRIITQRDSADKKRQLETLEVEVLRNGKPLDAALLSGGEGVIVAESLALAITLDSAARAGGSRPLTLLRDEVGANLDEERAPAYTRLLARAAKIGGFSKVLFVSHHRRGLELADARLQFGDSTITVS